MSVGGGSFAIVGFGERGSGLRREWEKGGREGVGDELFHALSSQR